MRFFLLIRGCESNAPSVCHLPRRSSWARCRSNYLRIKNKNTLVLFYRIKPTSSLRGNDKGAGKTRLSEYPYLRSLIGVGDPVGLMHKHLSEVDYKIKYDRSCSTASNQRVSLREWQGEGRWGVSLRKWQRDGKKRLWEYLDPRSVISVGDPVRHDAEATIWG